MGDNDNPVVTVQGFYLDQPWADAVVEGLLPVLIQTVDTTKRDRLLVISTSGLDGEYVAGLDAGGLARAKDLLRYRCVVGSVEIDRVEAVDGVDALPKLVEIAGEEARDFYPKHLLRAVDPNRTAYLWVLVNPIKVSQVIPHVHRAARWTRVGITEEQRVVLSTPVPAGTRSVFEAE
jgi:hypothetical protein